MQMTYQLIQGAECHIPNLYDWDRTEKDRELYTCRPLHNLLPFDEYKQNHINAISRGIKEVFVLIEDGDSTTPLGKVTLFDYNPRNHSKEVGYYIPPSFRGKGLGFMMLSFLLTKALSKEGGLNKIYATTSSDNIQSMGLLEKAGFRLDGRLREHYWVNNKKFDQLHYSILQRELSNQPG